MIASWMLYAAVVGGLITLAAIAIERVAAARGRPARFVWLAALALSMGWPAGNAARRLMPAPEGPATVLPFVITLPSTTIAAAGPADRAALIDRLLLSVWIGLSVLFIARLTQAVVSLRRTRNRWQMSDVDGTPVRLSENVGPAVIGLRSMDVVLPEWIMTLEPSLRAIVLRHEEEHRTARDPYLLFAAGVAVALMPWNLALWFQAKRLRLAIEMDCDRRVLRAHPSPERYGMLMLTIAQRRSIAPAMFAPMLSEPATQLEQRILAMRTTTRKLTRVTVYGGSTLAAAALLFACAVQSDELTNPSPAASANQGGGLAPVQLKQDSSAPRLQSGQTYFEFQVEKQVSVLPGNLAPPYPVLLGESKASGEVLAQFVVDTLGHADMKTFKVLKSSHDLFTATVRDNLAAMRFSPAQVGGRKVKQLVQMPFQFSLGHQELGDSTTSAHTPIPPKPGAPEILKLPAVVMAAPDVAPPGTRPPAAPTRVYDSTTFHEFQIEKAATVIENGFVPRYPDLLRSAKTEGEVTAQFVVDQNGHVDPNTLKVLASSHALFTAAVRDALPMLKYYPAQVGGRNVKQLVQKTFTFSLTK